MNSFPDHAQDEATSHSAGACGTEKREPDAGGRPAEPAIPASDTAAGRLSREVGCPELAAAALDAHYAESGRSAAEEHPELAPMLSRESPDIDTHAYKGALSFCRFHGDTVSDVETVLVQNKLGEGSTRFCRGCWEAAGHAKGWLPDLRAYVAELRERARLREGEVISAHAPMGEIADEIEERFLSIDRARAHEGEGEGE